MFNSIDDTQWNRKWSSELQRRQIRVFVGRCLRPYHPFSILNGRKLNEQPMEYHSHSNPLTSSKCKWVDTLICHTTMCMNRINFLYNPDHVTLWCGEVGPVANFREGSKQELDWARVEYYSDVIFSLSFKVLIFLISQHIVNHFPNDLCAYRKLI